MTKASQYFPFTVADLYAQYPDDFLEWLRHDHPAILKDKQRKQDHGQQRYRTDARLHVGKYRALQAFLADRGIYPGDVKVADPEPPQQQEEMNWAEKNYMRRVYGKD